MDFAWTLGAVSWTSYLIISIKSFGSDITEFAIRSTGIESLASDDDYTPHEMDDIRIKHVTVEKYSMWWLDTGGNKWTLYLPNAPITDASQKSYALSYIPLISSL